MGWFLRKSFRVLPGIRLNISKSGPRLSIGVPGARASVGVDGKVRLFGGKGPIRYQKAVMLTQKQDAAGGFSGFLKKLLMSRR